MKQPNNIEKQDLQMAHAIELIGGKWKLRILWVLSRKEPLRYGQIRANVPNITDMMLSQSLRELTRAGLLQRHAYQEIPPRVEYTLTANGHALSPILKALANWAENYKQPHTGENID